MANNDGPTSDSNANTDPLFVDPNLLRKAVLRSEQRLASRPDDRTGLRALAELYRKVGDLDQAAAAYGRLCALDPEDREAAYLQAVLGGTESPLPPTGMHASPFVLVKNFLPPDFHDGLIPMATANREKFVHSRVGRHAEYKPDVRQTLEFNEKWEDGERFASYLAKIPNLLPRLHLTPFPRDISAIRIRAYEDGHFFRAHIDAEPNAPSASRVYNFVYYFHRMPRPYTGGDLLLFDTDLEAVTFSKERYTRVVPEDNSIILFPCTYFHSVLQVRCPSREFGDSRFVINGHVSRRATADEGTARPEAAAGS